MLPIKNARPTSASEGPIKEKKMKTLMSILLVLMTNVLFAQNSSNFYDIKAQTLEGETFDFSQLKGKKVLIVNTASKCGFTSQYKELEELNKKYGGKKFAILGFPSNDFMNQEPLSEKDIREFCTINYGVTFQMMSKISVKGDDIHPVYQWLTSKQKNGVMDSKVKWNFQKYLVDENGVLISTLPSSENPLSETITNWIEGKQ